MGKNDLDEAVANWIEKSGRALELRTARVFQRHPEVRVVTQSVAYEDPSTSGQREGDVRAAFHWTTEGHAVALEVAAECKAGKGHPWVAFLDNSGSRNRLSEWAVKSGSWPTTIQAKVERALEWEDWMAPSQIASHAASALGDDKHNTAHDAARQALSFARARALSPWKSPDEQRLIPISAIFPVVVTQAPLYTCELGSGGEALLERVDEFDVRVHASGTARHRVYVKNEAALERMAHRLSGVRRRLPS